MPKQSTNWTKEQLLVVLDLYFRIPFGAAHSRNPDVIHVAKLIGRTPAAVAFKLGNFGSFDPNLKKRGVSGLSNTSKLDQEIWNEYSQNPELITFTAAMTSSKCEGIAVEKKYGIETEDLSDVEGKERTALIKIRVNQSVFRKRLLAIYDNTCCITGLNIPELLVASHIVPWSQDAKNRLNPANGLAMNALHDRAYETGLLGIAPDYTIHISSKLQKSALDAKYPGFFFQEGEKLRLPKKFLPDPKLLEKRFKEKFIK